MTIIQKVKRSVKQRFNQNRVKNKTKIFCIGVNKTGTTSFKKAFIDLGYIVGKQKTAERLLRDYQSQNFNAIIDYCKSAQVFQDIPFSLPDTFKHLDKAFPNAKFVLTVRDNPEQWYQSLVSYHSKMFGNGNIPSSSDLKKANYVWKGWVWEWFSCSLKTSEADPYNKERLINGYNDHNEAVATYFKDRPNDWLQINVSEPGSYQKLMAFLNIETSNIDFPWENKTKSTVIK